jgi:hypothetical protein
MEIGPEALASVVTEVLSPHSHVMVYGEVPPDTPKFQAMGSPAPVAW